MTGMSCAKWDIGHRERCGNMETVSQNPEHIHRASGSLFNKAGTYGNTVSVVMQYAVNST